MLICYSKHEILMNVTLVTLQNATEVRNIPPASSSEESRRLFDSDILERKAVIPEAPGWWEGGQWGLKLLITKL